MRRRNVSPVFPSFDSSNLTAIILAAGEATPIKYFGAHRSTALIGENYLLGHQINAIKKRFGDIGDIIVCGGYEIEQVEKIIPGYIRLITNDRYAETGPVYSLKLAMRATLTNSVLVVAGDLFFTHEDLFCSSDSYITEADMGKEKVGLIAGEKLSHMEYGLPRKFGQIAYFNQDDTNKLRKLLGEIDVEKKYLFEIINCLVQRGSNICVKKNAAVEIDAYRTVKDLM